MQTVENRWDARYFQIIFQCTFLSYGIGWLGWQAEWLQFSLYIGTALFFQWFFESLFARRVQPVLGANSFLLKGGLSALISALSLCLLLKTNFWQICVLASFISIAGKFLLRVNGRHVFNPSALGIVAVIYFTGKAWLSPAQWGSNTLIFFMVATLGTIVITRVQKMDVCFAFLAAFLGAMFVRQVIYLNWPADYFWHTMSTGSLLLFTFFMISDPKTAPDHPVARIAWGAAIGLVSFYVTSFRFVNGAPIKVLVIMAPLVPVLNSFFKAKTFSWADSIRSYSFKNLLSIFKIKQASMKKIITIALVVLLVNNDVFSFCGFYVAKADGTLKNKTSQVILVRDGNKNVITMYNDFKGNFKDFAMVVPVPTVLKQSDIKVVDQSIFDRLNDYSKPRLVEYYDQNPCLQYNKDDMRSMDKAPSAALSEVVTIGMGRKKSTVKIEAQYLVGEYDILILSAQESSGLKTWLTENGYKIPAGAEEVLEPYIKSNLKFFVVKVNMDAKKKLPGEFLRPLQITFNSPKFMLPIRLGMANADGDQDMIVYAFTRKGRVECTNYRSVSLPTGKNVPLFVLQNFGVFYSNLFQHQWVKEGKNIALLEYAWDVSPQNYVKCDPCVGNPPTPYDIVQAGVWWTNKNWNDYSDVDNEDEDGSNNVYFTRLHVRYNRDKFPQDLMFQVTPNKESFQARYVVTHPATGDFSCEAGKAYLKELRKRRKGELEELAWLTGKTYENWDMAYEEGKEENEYISGTEAAYSSVAAIAGGSDSDSGRGGPGAGLILAGSLLGMGVVMRLRQQKLKPVQA
jgi:Na+-translocating ferredoxin:NAD+ oxidoreductase RnfD subunit